MIVAARGMAAGDPAETRLRLRAAAGQVVQDLAEELPILTDRRRASVGALAEHLGATVLRRADMDARARWQVRRESASAVPLWGDPGCDIHEIHVRADLRSSASRFAIAHELGHVVLHRRFPALADELPVHWQEFFANDFARELLVPAAFRAEIRQEFRSAIEPVEFLRLAESLGVSTQTLFRFVRVHDDWMRGVDRLWLDIRYRPNRYTRREPRLRVVGALFDPDRWYMPTNRSVQNACGGDEWLRSLGWNVASNEAEIEISAYDPGSVGPDYVKRRVRTTLRAVRLRGSHRPGAEVIASASLPGDTGPTRPARSQLSLAL